MNIDDVTRACIAAGFRGDSLVKIVAIAGRESNWSEAVADTRRFTERGSDGIWRDPQTGDELDYGIGPEYSVGPFQINLNVHPLSYEEAQDVNASAAFAFRLSEGGTNFRPWSAENGLDESFRDQAREAIDRITAEEGNPEPMPTPEAERVGLDVAQADTALIALSDAVNGGAPLYVQRGPDMGQVTIIGTVQREALIEIWPALSDILPE